jgi:ABC-type ATPase involved in cell division
MSEALDRMRYFYGQTDGSYSWPNSAEGDLLRICAREIETLRTELKLAIDFHKVAIKERDMERRRVDMLLRQRVLLEQLLDRDAVHLEVRNVGRDQRTTRENVSDTLDAVVRLIRDEQPADEP